MEITFKCVGVSLAKEGWKVWCWSGKDDRCVGDSGVAWCMKWSRSLLTESGWIHRSTLARRGVTQIGRCRYIEVNDTGLVVERDGIKQTLEVQTGKMKLLLLST